MKAYVTQQNALYEQMKDTKLFKEAGVSSSANDSNRTAQDEINTKVDALMASEPKLTQPEAFDRVVMSDRGLAGRYRAERSAAINPLGGKR
jgi:hypothetical protein